MKPDLPMRVVQVLREPPLNGLGIFWFLVIFLVLQVPLYGIEYPNIRDLYNHLARLSIQLALDGDPGLKNYYHIHWSLSPNAAMDVLAEGLGRIMNLPLVLKLLMSLATLAQALGAVSLNRALNSGANGWTPWPASLSLLACSHIFADIGLINFNLSVGLALGLTAAWIRLRRRSDTRFWGFVLICACAGVVYLFHPYGLGVYLLCGAAFEWVRFRLHADRRALLRVAALFAGTAFVPVVIHLFFYERGVDLPQLIYPLEPVAFAVHKLGLLLLWPFTMVSTWFPIQASVVLVTLALACWGVVRGRVQFHRAAVVMLLAMLLCFLLLPQAGFGSGLVDFRLLLPMALLVLAGCRLNLPNTER